MTKRLDEIPSKDFDKLTQEISLIWAFSSKSILERAERYDVDKNELFDFYLHIVTNFVNKTDMSKYSGRISENKILIGLLKFLKSIKEQQNNETN